MSDLYRAGRCPKCGEFAVNTQRHIGAPVFCKNGHSWQRPNIEQLQTENEDLKAKLEIIEDELTIAYMAGFKKEKEKNDE